MGAQSDEFPIPLLTRSVVVLTKSQVLGRSFFRYTLGRLSTGLEIKRSMIDYIKKVIGVEGGGCINTMGIAA